MTTGTLSRLFALCLVPLMFVGCPIDWVKLAGALASAPVVKPIGFVETISSDRKSITFAARVNNTGIADASGPFTVDMAVSIEGQYVSGIKRITVPATATVKGTQSAGTAGGVLVTEVIYSSLPYKEGAVCEVAIWVDADGVRWSYLTKDVKSFHWSGRLSE